jgi:hypothetical protein
MQIHILSAGKKCITSSALIMRKSGFVVRNVEEVDVMKQEKE